MSITELILFCILIKILRNFNFMAILLNFIISYKIITNLTTKVIPLRAFNNKGSYNLIKFVIL